MANMLKLELKPDIIDDGSHAIHQKSQYAGFTKDGLYSWIYNESVLEIIYSNTNESIAQWRFGKAINDRNTVISCVTEFEYADGHMFLVATESLSDEGMLCLFSLSKKTVVRAIEIPAKIKAVEVLFTNDKEDVPPWILSKHLNFFCGLAAVGTEGGYTYLVDLCLDDVMINSTAEIHPKKLSVSSPNLVDPKSKRHAVCSSDKHLAILIDEQCHRDGQFYHRRQDDTIDKVFEEDAVFVTSLKYLSQAGILAIGFNFGCFQLWRLYGPVLDYSTRFQPNANAISTFVVQEPENDPRNLVYLWIGRDNSVLGEDLSHGKVSSISLFQLCFNKKETYPSFGLFYEDLESVSGRLEHNLLTAPYLGGRNHTTWSSQIICANTIVNPLYTPPASVANDSFEEGSHGNDLSLSLFVWRADSKQSGQNACYWMGIFDLNRWYHAQMPHAIRCTGNTTPQVCPYWAVYKLDDVVALSYPQSLLYVQVTGNNVLKFINKSPLPPEEHSYPSALEITDMKFVTPQRSISGHCYGWQGHLLQELVHEGALHLVQPANFYYQCLQARLIPQNHNENKANSVEHQRNVLLNLSLDHNLTARLLHNCINLWGDGEYVDAGCSLTLLLEWAWTSVGRIKEKLDTACKALYDCSGHPLDPYTDWSIRRQHCSLVSLREAFTIFISQTNPTTNRGLQELEIRMEVIKHLVQHFNMVRWCMVEGLLPEVKDGSTQMPGLFEYPYEELCRAAKKRRTELKALNGVVTDHSLLLIDGLVKCAGPQISTIWESEEGQCLYPPSSMQALMNLFLLEDVILEVKQAILLYLLQDLAAVLGCDKDHQSVVVSFVRSFNLLPSLVHTLQGIWFIDHRDHEEGLRQLVNPNVQPHSWSTWVDVAVVNTLLAQGQNATAAHYIHSGHCLGATLDEQKLNIAVLVRNRKVSPAVDYMRQRCYHKQDPTDLMPFMMSECQGNKMIGQLLQLHLLPSEEAEVEKYLRDRSEPQALEPLLLYYLTHSRFVEAFMLNEEMNKMDKLEATSLAAREKAANRNRLMEAYLRVLPDITRKLLMEKQHRPSAITGKRVEVTKPKPLSTVVYKKDQNAISRSHLIMAVMDKVDEAMNAVHEAHSEEETVEPEDMNNSVFMATPLTPRHKTFPSLASTQVAMTNPESLLSSMPINPLSAAKKELQKIHVFGEESEGLRSLSALTKECINLLTPSKGVKSETSPKSTFAFNVIKTPQSILKVRRLSKSGFFSAKDSKSFKTPPDAAKRPRKLGFSSSDTAIPSPSSPPVEKLSSPLDPSHVSKSATTTPKHLRFVGLSPTPSPSPSPLPFGSKESLIESEIASSSNVSEEDSPELQTGVAEVMDVQEGENKEIEIEKEKTNQVISIQENQELSSELPEGNVPKDQNVESMEIEVPQPENLEENKEDEPLDEGTTDRYVDELGNLVRPDLLSPWKNHHSSEEMVTVDENQVSMNISHLEEESITPAMTSSPLEETLVTRVDVSIDSTIKTSAQDSAGMELPENEVEAVATTNSEEDSSERAAIYSRILQALEVPSRPEGTANTSSITKSEEKKSLSSHTSITDGHTSSVTKSKEETSYSRILQALEVPSRQDITANTSSIIKSEEEKSLSSHTSITHGHTSSISKSEEETSSSSRTSITRGHILNVDTSLVSFSVERSLRSKDASSPERKIRQESESPPATPPLSKRAKMIVRGKDEIRKSKFDLATPRMSIERELRSRRTPERKSPSRSVRNVAEKEVKESDDTEKVIEDASKLRQRRTPERRSPARSHKRKAVESGSEKEEEIIDQYISVSSRLRNTPERHVAVKSAKNVTEDEMNRNVEDVLETNKSRQRKTPERKSPSRSVKRKALDSDSENDGEKQEQSTMSISSRLRKTPERKSPARSMVKNTNDNEFQSIDMSEEQVTETKVGRSERKSPSRSVKKKNPESELEDEKYPQKEGSEMNSLEDRKSPSRSVVEKNLKEKADTEEEVSSNESSSRLRSSPARDRKSRTPDRRLTRKSRVPDNPVIEEESSMRNIPSDEVDQGNEKLQFLPAEDVLGKLREEDLTPSSPTRRRSTRLNTPERVVISPARRSSRGRHTSVSVSAEDNEKEVRQSRNEPATPKKGASLHSIDKSKSPGHQTSDDITPMTEDNHSVRRSRRQSRTPERFRSEIGESTFTSRQSLDKSEQKVPSPTRKSTRKPKSPERLNTEQIQTIMLPSSPRRDLIIAQKASLEDMAKDTEDKAGEPEDEEVFTEDLPVLRLDPEEEVSRDGEAEGKVTNIKKSKDSHVKGNESMDFPAVFKDRSVSHLSTPAMASKNIQESFVFSNPLTHTSATAEGSPEENKTDDQVFLFSAPTIAKAQSIDEKSSSEKEGVNKQNVTRKSSRRQKKILLGSPNLLPVSTPELQSLKERSRSRRSDIQQASANVVKRYSFRRSGPLTRRLVPSSRSSVNSVDEK